MGRNEAQLAFTELNTHLLSLVFKVQDTRTENMCFDSHWSLQKSLACVCVCACVLWSLINICWVNERMDEYTAFNHLMD